MKMNIWEVLCEGKFEKNIYKNVKKLSYFRKKLSFDLRKTAVRRKTYDTVPESDIRDLTDFMLVWILELGNRVRLNFSLFFLITFLVNEVIQKEPQRRDPREALIQSLGMSVIFLRYEKLLV